VFDTHTTLCPLTALLHLSCVERSWVRRANPTTDKIPSLDTLQPASVTAPAHRSHKPPISPPTRKRQHGPPACRPPILGIPIYWHAIILVGCILIASHVASLEARTRSEDPEHIWNGVILVVIFGIIGAKLYQIIPSPQTLVRGFD
jgi:hypothetical protein